VHTFVLAINTLKEHPVGYGSNQERAMPEIPFPRIQVEEWNNLKTAEAYVTCVNTGITLEEMS